MLQFKAWDQPTDTDIYKFMTTISMPVYDRRENAVSTAEKFNNIT